MGRVVVAEDEADSLAFEHIRRLDRCDMSVDGLVGIRGAPLCFCGVAQGNPQAAVVLQDEVDALVADDQIVQRRPGLHNPIFLPPRPGQDRSVTRRARANAHVDARPDVVQLQPGLGHQARRPPSRVGSFVHVDAVTRLGKDLVRGRLRRAFPHHAPAVTDQIARRCIGPFEVMIPELGVAFARHPNVHPIWLQPRHPARPVGAHAHQGVPLPLIGKPVEA